MYSEDIRNLAIKLYHKILNLRKVASLIDVNYSTISRWNNYVPIPRKKIVKKLDGSDISESIKLYISSHPCCTLKDIQQIIHTTFKIQVSLELIRLFLVRNNYSKKKVKYYSEPKDDKSKLELFLDYRVKYIKEGRKFISIDETSFGRNFLSTFGYSIKGHKIYIKRPYVRITTQSVVSAVAVDNPIYFYKKDGSFNTESFSKFLNSLNYSRGSVLLMDNVKFHHSRVVKEIAKNKEWDILYIPPYSPIFNPIEGVFSIVKRVYSKCLSIETSFDAVTNNHVISFFKQSFNAVNRF